MNDLLLQVIVIAIIANVILMLIALIGPRVRRAMHRSPAPAGAMSMSSGSLAAVGAGDAMLMSSPGYEMSEAPLPMQPPIEGPAPVVPPAPAPSEPAVAPAPARPDDPPWDDERIDPATGLMTGIAFDEIVRHEDGRLARYGRPATVVVCELDRLDALASRIGRDNADRLIPPVAAVLLRQARTPDLVARIDRARFHVLLPETDEVQAIHYVERVRDACDVWLEASAISVRLVIGWASATSGGSLRDALRLAEQRMHAERSRVAIARTPADDEAAS